MSTYNTLKAAKLLIKNWNFVLPFRGINITQIRSLLLLWLRIIWSMAISQARTTIWLEDFQVLADVTTGDDEATAWSRDVTSCGFTYADKGCFKVHCDKILGKHTEGEGIWHSRWIDISRNCNKPFIFLIRVTC
jgi:hypothetical protein